MININVFSKSCVVIENTEFNIENQQDMIKFLEELLNKAFYSGEKLCIEEATIVSNGINTPITLYRFIKEW